RGPPDLRHPTRPAQQRAQFPVQRARSRPHDTEEASMTNVLAAEGGYQEFELLGGEWAILAFSGAAALLAILVGFVLMRGVLAADQGTPKMVEIATAIQDGAWAYLKRQFRTIGFILVPLAAIVFVTSTEILKPEGEVALSFAA